MDPASSQMGRKESAKDTARVLGRLYDGIEYRGASQETVETLAEFSGVPVWNGLTDEFHPTQILADVMTMKEHSFKPIPQIKFAFVGDARNNMGNSLMTGGSLLGMDVRLVGPRELWPDQALVDEAHELAQKNGGSVTITDDVAAGVKDVDYVYTDVWVSMGESHDVWKHRIELLQPYQVNAELLAKTGNPNTKFMHCLPAFHGRDTTVGEEIFEQYGVSELEVTDEVFESPASIVFDQAENRMHTIKAVLVATMTD
jgi:ornithine carbamoyltransferase